MKLYQFWEKGVGVTFVSKGLGVYKLEDGSDIYGMI